MTAASERHRHERWHALRALAEDLPLFLTAPLYRRWHLRWGATAAEASLPGDDLQPQAQFRGMLLGIKERAEDVGGRSPSGATTTMASG